MRIIYHHRTLGDGAEGIHVREMIRAFRQEGNDVRVTGPVGERTAGSQGAAGRLGLLGRVKRLMPPAAFEFAELAYGFLSFFGTLYHAMLFRPDFIYDRYITFNFGVVLAGRLLNIPALLEVNAPLALERRQQKDERLVLGWLATRIERWTYGLASRVIVVSTPLRDYLESCGVDPGHCVVMPNGANPDHFTVMPPDAQLQRDLGIPSDAFVVGFTGVLRGWHDLDLLVAAFGEMSPSSRPAVLLIVGDGPYRETLWRAVEERGLQQVVRITGLVAHASVPSYVSLFSAAVCPGATFYASPMKLLEYMAAGKAVVVPDTANFMDMVNPGVDGMAFRAGEVASFARCLEALRDSATLCGQLGVAARRRIEERLNWRWSARACMAIADKRKS